MANPQQSQAGKQYSSTTGRKRDTDGCRCCNSSVAAEGGRMRCHTFYFGYLFPVQQTTRSGIRDSVT